MLSFPKPRSLITLFSRAPAVMSVAVLLLLAGFAACSKPTSPEQQIRALLKDAEQAAEKKDVGTLRGYVSSNYADADGHDKRAIDAILRFMVLRHESIHLLTRIASIDFPQPTQARAVLYVAMAARPITDPTRLAAFRANLYRFDMTFADDGGWRVIGAQWRPAEPDDFIQ